MLCRENKGSEKGWRGKKGLGRRAEQEEVKRRSEDELKDGEGREDEERGGVLIQCYDSVVYFIWTGLEP